MPLQLFHSYLRCRKQAVYCNQTYSPLKNIDKGVTQDSILGPILFLIYINDLVHASNEFEFVIYDDATTLLSKDKDIDALHANFVSELNNVKLWVNANKLAINISKTKFLYFFFK